MILKSIRFLKEDDIVFRAGEQLEILEVVIENDFIAYKDAGNKQHFTTGEAFFSVEVKG